MNILMLVSAISFGVLGVIWKLSDYLNFFIKFTLIALCILNVAMYLQVTR